MECSHVFDRKQSPWRTEVWFVPLSGFKPSAFRPTAKRFPGLRTDAWTDSRKRRMKIPAMLLLPEESSYREMGRKVKKQSGALQASESILG
ncbi:hypothetical protein CXU12_12530 [Akkermansia muciniphila]|nr:hypothetical protein CXU12_12530 [Akkermansia muciniphila]